MKYRLTFKCPDAYCEDQTGDEIASHERPSGLEDWLDDGEYVTLEYNSKDQSMIVVRPDADAWSEKSRDEALLKEALDINTPEHLRILGVLTRSEIIEVPGSNSALWTIRLYSDGHHFCNCPSMKFERGLDDNKHCKHIRATDGMQGLNWSIAKEDDDGRDYENEIRLHDWGTDSGDVPSAPDA